MYRVTVKDVSVKKFMIECTEKAMEEIDSRDSLSSDACRRVVEQAARDYPEDITPDVQDRFKEYFFRNAELSVRNLVFLREEFGMFLQMRNLHPLLFVKDGVLPDSDGRTSKFIAFMGPSASGKDAILELADGMYTWVRTTTTRPKSQRDIPRGGHSRYEHVALDEFQRRIRKGEFIEWLPQFKNLYGTTKNAVEEVLENPMQIKLWRGEIFGVATIKEWMKVNFPEIMSLACFVIPRMPMGSFCTFMQERRGVETTLENRFPKALWEIYMAAERADVLIENPSDPTGVPYEAARATQILFNYLIAKV